MKRMVVDGGSTKCHWLAFGDGPDVLFASPGLNPLMLNFNEIVSRFLQAAEGREVGLVDEIYYYGAGCIGGEVNSKVAKALSQVFGCQSVVVYSDILGAARATLGRSSGIACILGTGCNSCHYDGENIVSNIPPLGYILGDEGSGADIGKRIVADALKGLFDNDLTSAFWKFAGCGYRDIIGHVYSEPHANAYLARFARFAIEHIDNASIESIVRERMAMFLSRNVLLYPEPVRRGGVGFVGGIAANFDGLLREVCADSGVSVRSIVETPISGIRLYHEV